MRKSQSKLAPEGCPTTVDLIAKLPYNETMREWKLKAGDPLCLTLAADARLGSTCYSNDHIWEIILGSGAPPALALQTTFGLRARAYRIFPAFKEGDTQRIDPGEFATPPTIRQIFPDFIRIEFSPFSDLLVTLEYWVPESQAVAGRATVVNQGSAARALDLSWMCQLAPTQGQRMAAKEMQNGTVLAGQTDNLAPVFFMTGGSKPGVGAYPSLSLLMNLPPNASQQVIWANAALQDQEASFKLARNIAAHNWEAVGSLHEMLNSSQVEIYTGDPDWDAAFMLSQKTALSLITGPTQALPYASFVQTRQPDHGYSLKGDGSDYNHLWNGQSPMDAYFLAAQILPAAPEIAKGLLRNFLAIQAQDGSIDWKPGLAGQRGRLNATPMLATLAWRIFEFTEDQEFLEKVFPPLLKFALSWFQPARDRDRDGIPEWDHPLQSGYEDHPIYSYWQDGAPGLDIRVAESPALCAMLYRECQSLLRMAQRLKQDRHLPTLSFIAIRLSVAVEAAWDPTCAFYFDWDRDTHLSIPLENIASRTGPGMIEIGKNFDHPTRLSFHLHPQEGATLAASIYIYGQDAGGNPIEKQVDARELRWRLQHGCWISDPIFTSLERVELKNAQASDRLNIYTAGTRSFTHTNLLPLWAGFPEPARAALMVEKTLCNPELFWGTYGIPACAMPTEGLDASLCKSVHLPWNTLIGEGLAAGPFRPQAAELVSRLMAAVIQALKREAGFRSSYNSETGQGMGEHNALPGLAPLSLFLDTLGVRLISPYRVSISGFNPFPWPVTVKYRGLTVLRQKEKTTLIFPDGQTFVVEDPSAQIVSLEEQPANVEVTGGVYDIATH
jgi:hypothetical protein